MFSVKGKLVLYDNAFEISGQMLLFDKNGDGHLDLNDLAR